MQHIQKSEAEVFENGAVIALEYETTSENNLSLISIAGRYPEAGFTTNKKVDSLIQIIGGTGVLGMKDGSIVELNPGDQIHLEIDDAYFFEGDLEIIYAATPKWTLGQTEHVEPIK